MYGAVASMGLLTGSQPYVPVDPDALAYLNFVTQVYEIDLGPSSLAAMLGGTDPSGFHAEGMRVSYDDTNRPYAIGALKDLIDAAFETGITLLFETERSIAVTGATLFGLSDATVDEYLWVASTPEALDAGTLSFGFGPTLNAPGINRFAFTFSRDIGGGSYRNAVSANGSAVTLAGSHYEDIAYTIASRFLTGIDAAKIGDVGDWDQLNHYEYFRKIIIYPPMDDAALAVLSGDGTPVGSAAGTSVAAAVGASSVDSAGAAAGVAAVAAVGASTFETVGAAAGVGAASGVGASAAAAVGAASGTSTAAAEAGLAGDAVGAAAGTSTVEAVGASGYAAIASAAGAGAASGVGASAADAVASAAGTSVGAAVGSDADSDPYFSNVVLLVAFDGVDGATTATDDSDSAHTLTFNGNAQLDTAQSKFGGASLLLDGSGDYVTAADSADWNFTGEFTIEAWVRTGVPTQNLTSISQYNTTGNQRSWSMEIFSSQLRFIYSTAGTDANIIDPTGDTVSADTWYHHCVDRDASGNLRLYVDGVMVHKATGISSALFNSTQALAIGARGTTVVWNGHIDEVRVTKGVARYASDSGFTAPTAAYPRS